MPMRRRLSHRVMETTCKESQTHNPKRMHDGEYDTCTRLYTPVFDGLHIYGISK